MNNSPHSPVVLSALLSHATIKLKIAGESRDAILEELVALVPVTAGQPAARQALLRVLLEREQLHSTGIGGGIALPHARNAVPRIVTEPVIVFGRHAKGIPYEAVDNAPVRLFFLLVSPSVTQQLAILARISRLLRDSQLRDALLKVEEAGDVLNLIRETEAKM